MPKIKLKRDGILSIAVMSDLHAYDEAEGQQPSHLKTTDPEDQPEKHPISGLLHLIQKTPLEADLLLCGGDFGDKARPAGIQYAWAKCHEVGCALRCQLLAATTGNHDVDSRYKYIGMMRMPLR